ncbi:alpha/beta hydrolase family protein [Fodinibius halophilus]|uniref:alpha/beta hydrolase family protein n=1 Tax=Fodinibius halophilus TaxID=1736908 RepID=UPI00197AF6AE|nr:alpha/beta fold hydrolase [Fodinibius halophilus]
METIVKKSDITLQAKDGFPLATTLFLPTAETFTDAIVIGSALGVPRYIYFKLARFFAEQGFAVLTFDYRGVHQSQDESVSGSEIKMAHWGSLDLDAALGWVSREWEPQKLYYLGHSCGSQILGLSPKAHTIDKAIFIAGPSGYWKLWEFPYRWGVWLIWHGLPLLTPWFDEFPARALGISSVNIPSGVARQWARWGKSPNYLWDHLSDEDATRYQQLTFPLLSLGFADDHYFGPPGAVKKLLQYYPSVHSELQLVQPQEYGQSSIGHFGFLKQNFSNNLWPRLLKWFQN